MGVLGLTPFLQKTCPEVIKKLPDRLRGLAGKKVVIDGTLITQRLHFAPMPHPYRHVQMWHRLMRELQEAGVSVVCVFDGKERNTAKAREIARRKEVQRIVKARGALEFDRSKRLNQLSGILPSFWRLDDTTSRRTSDFLRRLTPDFGSAEETRQTPATTTPIGSTRTQDGIHKTTVTVPSSEELLTPRLSVDVDFPIPEYVADETVVTDSHLVSDYVDSVLLEADSPRVKYSSAHVPPYHQEPKAPFYPEPFHSPFEFEPDIYTIVAPKHTDDFLPHFVIEDSPLASAHEPEPGSPEDNFSQLSSKESTSHAQTTYKFDTIPTTPSSESISPSTTQTPPTPEDILGQLSDLYLSYRQSVSRLAALSNPLDSSPFSIPSVGDPDTQAEIVMTKAQYQLTLEEGRFWDAFAAEPRGAKLPDVLKMLTETSECMSASFERRMNPPTSSTYLESKEILKAMGVPCLETSGAYEAEALASSMVLNGLADYVVSEDTDVLIYEAPLVRNLTNKNAPLTLVSGAEIRALLQLDRASFVDFAILLGTDFSQRIKNVGPARALKFIREHGSIERFIELETKFAPPLAPEAYLNQVEAARLVFRTLPPVPDPELLEQGEPDEAKVIELLQKYGLGKEVMGMGEWGYEEALKGNYFEDNPHIF
ncbi:putative flap endonuclease 1 like protein [Termitomyces sp. T112]|nr:putative flap endonuclease 1 like protein [Termitomyces sp. T112]